jgi:hypothetical protein
MPTAGATLDATMLEELLKKTRFSLGHYLFDKSASAASDNSDLTAEPDVIRHDLFLIRLPFQFSLCGYSPMYKI